MHRGNMCYGLWALLGGALGFQSSDKKIHRLVEHSSGKPYSHTFQVNRSTVLVWFQLYAWVYATKHTKLLHANMNAAK